MKARAKRKKRDGARRCLPRQPLSVTNTCNSCSHNEVLYESRYLSVSSDHVPYGILHQDAALYRVPQRDNEHVAPLFSLLRALCHARGHDFPCDRHGDGQYLVRDRGPRRRSSCRMVQGGPFLRRDLMLRHRVPDRPVPVRIPAGSFREQYRIGRGRIPFIVFLYYFLPLFL